MAAYSRYTSFPVIAAAAILLAAVFGFALGSIGGKPTAVPKGTEIRDGTATPVERKGPLEAKAGDDTRRTTTTTGPDRPDGTVGTRPDREVARTPLPPGTPRVLPDGRTDPIATAAFDPVPKAVLIVRMFDDSGRQLPFPQLALDVESGPLGWQPTGKQPGTTPDERGAFRFEGLYPGRYRARSTQTNYAPAEAIVEVMPVDVELAAELRLTPLPLQKLEIFIRYEDGVSPEEVHVHVNPPDPVDGANGRFGEHRVSSAVAPGSGVMGARSYRQRLDPNGMLRMNLNSAQDTTIGFAAARDGIEHAAQLVVKPGQPDVREYVTLKPGTLDGLEVPVSAAAGSLEVTMKLNGSDAAFTRVGLRTSINEFRSLDPQVENGRYVWANLTQGRWFLVAEAPDVHAPFVHEIHVRGPTTENVDFKTCHLRVNVSRENGSPDADGKPLLYRVRLRTRGSGSIERSYNGNLTGKSTDFIDFFVPEGDMEVRLEAPENSPALNIEPQSQTATIKAGARADLQYTIRSGATLKFRCVDANGRPLPNAEFLVTFHAAGNVPETEKSKVVKAGPDGLCQLDSAPWGPVYIMIWTGSTDWANPDRVFKTDLPAFGTKDLGNIIAQ